MSARDAWIGRIGLIGAVGVVGASPRWRSADDILASSGSIQRLVPSAWIRSRQQNPLQFEDVPPETFAEFRAAFAKGRFFNDHIRNQFRYRLVGTQ
ncbi:MAG: KTSC domain-containing protein [Mesorhizobium sp.]|nr:MAG: KTSC domain-containing protein [Mesorhizobium sp.]